MMPDTDSAPSPRTFDTPAINDPQDLTFGKAPQPVRCGLGLEIGAGRVFPEINFTLPPMLLDPDSRPRVQEIFDRTVSALLERARDLALPGVVIEFEHLPPMTADRAWGAELTRLIKSHLRRAHEEWGLPSALRVTIVDLRDESRPPQRRRGQPWQNMRDSLTACAAAGADILSVESTGGKEVHDVGLTRADMSGIVFALGVLAPADMAFLWDAIAAIAHEHAIIAGGDSACGFANTAMQLAGQKMLPDVLAAIVRAMSAARTLVAHEHGAVGPSKDCAYENPVVKAITGVPVSMEGRSATCAHLSPIGNIAAIAADLWSNESVPDVRLLSGPAPVASLESLAYDCRLFNAAIEGGKERELCDLHVAGDAPLSAQAALLTPDATIALARVITAEPDPYRRTLATGRTACQWLQERLDDGNLQLPQRETRWLDKLRTAVDALPDNAEELRTVIAPRYGKLFDAPAYGLPA